MIECLHNCIYTWASFTCFIMPLLMFLDCNVVIAIANEEDLVKIRRKNVNT